MNAGIRVCMYVCMYVSSIRLLVLTKPYRVLNTKIVVEQMYKVKDYNMEIKT